MARAYVGLLAGALCSALLVVHCSPNTGAGGHAHGSAIGADGAVDPIPVGTGGSDPGLIGGFDGSIGGASGCVNCADAGPQPGCGNGILEPNEVCDDGNTVSGDGCVGTCVATEQDYACPTPGVACVSTVKCGDGKISGAENCDDGNPTGGDGCDATCTVEQGWVCPVVGARCVAAACGDSLVAGTETCDDGNLVATDGCDATCHRTAGYACGNPGDLCHLTHCGDGTVEGDEQCDDGNVAPYDGCSPTCTKEPTCTGGACTAVCGDGLKFPQESCDDGNTTSGDGCSATCAVENGFTCDTVTLDPPTELDIPILYRDFLYAGTTSPGPGHPDFEAYSGSGTGLVATTLGADGIPVFAASIGAGSTKTAITSADTFYWWYHDQKCDTTPCTANPYEQRVFLDKNGNPTTLPLASQGGGVYQFTSTSFFPVDGLGWNTPDASHGNHNFSFTSELRYQFTYSGTEVLTFTGDDDVYVFINGQLAVDLGGVHGAESGTATLANQAAALGLTVGGMYEIALFQAERHTKESNYTLSLGGFVHAVSQCKSKCGDGIVTPDEVCDDGKNDGSYGSCSPDCKSRGPYCGDDHVDVGHETCDDGVNLSPYGGCAPGCVPGDKCGDGKVDSRFGEQCDDGKNDGAYGGCTNQCRLAPHCGDGITQPAEEACDDGKLNGSPGACSKNCQSNNPS